MIPSLGDRLGKQGYTIVARAPELGLPQLADGSWHVLGGSNPTLPDQMHELDLDLIPFILSNGGDIVIYRLSDDGMGAAKPILSRGGMSGRPPQLMTVHPFDADLARGLSVIHSSRSKPVAPPVQALAAKRTDWRLAGCVAAVFALLLGSGAYAVIPMKNPARPGNWIPDMSNPRDVALSKGATVIARPSRNDPETMELYRLYPSADGKEVSDHVGSFKRRDLENWSGELPDSRVEWRRNF